MQLRSSVYASRKIHRINDEISFSFPENRIEALICTIKSKNILTHLDLRSVTLFRAYPPRFKILNFSKIGRLLFVLGT